MQIVFSPKAKDDFDYWVKINKSMAKKINKLIAAIIENPFIGIGKPEQLKHQLSGYWSRRINKEHRIVYEVLEEENKIVVLSLKGHYI